jgi:uncharacterized protein (DUF58 family)
MKSLFLTNRFFSLFGVLVLLFVLAFPFPILFVPAQALLVLALALVLTDALLLFRNAPLLKATRRLPKVLSLGDNAEIVLETKNSSALSLQLTVIEELPVQLQLRDFKLKLSLQAGERKTSHYAIRPTTRGEYEFGNINYYASTLLGLLERRMIIPASARVPVYPSIIQMRKLELGAFQPTMGESGIKRLRRLGHSYEFEHIKSYVRGDDYRSINWKASSRRGTLMVNQYQDERSQQVYCLIDKSRTMKLPFEGLSLMDHAINASLVMSNLALKKHDKAGLLTFSDKIGAVIKADRKANQLHQILHALYKEKENPLEVNFELAFYAIKKFIKRRSLLLLFTNFESTYALDRVLPILRKLSRAHLLVVVLFRNTEVEDFTHQDCTTIEEIYQQTVARQFIAEKEQMVQKLKQFGIQAILTRPDELAINSVNKYLELKAKGLI